MICSDLGGTVTEKDHTVHRNSLPPVRKLPKRHRMPYRSLDFMTVEAALELLNSGERGFGQEAEKLIDNLGGLPLALELAGKLFKPEACPDHRRTFAGDENGRRNPDAEYFC